MKQRIVFGAIGAVLAVSAFLYANAVVILACVALIALMAIGEFLKAVSVSADKCKRPIVVLTYLLSLGMIAGVAYGSLGGDYISGLGYSVIALALYIILAFAIMVLKHANIRFADVAVSMLGCVYITVSLVHIYLLRAMPEGKLYIWLPFIIAWLTDTFAYFTGVFFGKHKLIPSVSPKKTIEGSVGGIAGAVIIVLVFQYVCSKTAGVTPNYITGVLMSLVCSVASQFGDLAASCIKREHDIKDYGSIMPGHGGVLDRFDSVIYISPLVFMIVYYIGIF